jgi:hypothetical protein
MDRTIWGILKFRRRSLLKGTLAIRKTVAVGLAVAFAPVPMASGLLPTTAEARPRPAAPQTQASSANGCTLRSARERDQARHLYSIRQSSLHP